MMNQFITFDEAARFLKNPPPVMPRPDFTKIKAIQAHITKALKQLDCPQCHIHGWLGLAMDLMMYVLIELSPFIAPPDPGNVQGIPTLQHCRCPKQLINFAKMRKFITSRTLTSAVHASACSMKTSLISSRCPTTLR
jgi:hypothetical protein